MRLLLITNTPPTPSWGGAMTFHRHFCERDDFTVATVTTEAAAIEEYNPDYPCYLLEDGSFRRRMKRTRLGQFLHSWDHLTRGGRIPAGVMKFAKDFRPDAVFTVGGSWLWTARLATAVSDRLHKPLIGSFNDWWFYNQIHHPWMAARIEQSFRKFYQRCDLALCTSEGMREALGNHPNAAVWYPTGDAIDKLPPARPAQPKFTVGFAGNLGEWYGEMVEQLVTTGRSSDSIDFRIFGSRPNWSPSFLHRAQESNVFRGQVPFSQLREEMTQVDALLLPMGFGDENKIIEQTSFKTKFLDYLSFGRPVIVWGPEYCSAVRVAREFDSAAICTSEDPVEAFQTLDSVAQSVERRQQLVENAWKMYQARFHPDSIHRTLVDNVGRLIGRQKQAA